MTRYFFGDTVKCFVKQLNFFVTQSSADSNRSSQKQYINNNNVIVNSAHQDRVLIGPQYRMTFAEQDRMKRKNKQIKKEEKAKAREERLLRTKWNLDSDLINKHELDFR